MKKQTCTLLPVLEKYAGKGIGCDAGREEVIRCHTREINQWRQSYGNVRNVLALKPKVDVRKNLKQALQKTLEIKD